MNRKSALSQEDEVDDYEYLTEQQVGAKIGFGDDLAAAQ